MGLESHQGLAPLTRGEKPTLPGLVVSPKSLALELKIKGVASTGCKGGGAP